MCTEFLGLTVLLESPCNDLFCVINPSHVPDAIWLLVIPLVVNADLHERRVVLKDLDTVHLYKAFLAVSTYGGSLNGSTIQFNVENFGWYCVSFLEPQYMKDEFPLQI